MSIKTRFNNKVIAVLYFTFLIFSIFFMLVIAFKKWQTLQQAGWLFDYNLLVASIIGATTLLLMCVYGWDLILGSFGQKLSYKKSVLIWAISLPTRYIPGGIWGYASRVSLAKAEGVDLHHAIVSMYIETLLIIVSSILTGLIAFFLTLKLPMKSEIILLTGILAGLMLYPGIMKPLLRILTINKSLNKSIQSLNVRFPSARSIFFLSAYYILYWVVCGVFFLLFVLSIYPLNYKNWILVGSCFPLCYFIGFIVFFVPSGIGIRESALYIALSPIIPHEANLLVSIGSRFWLLSGEIVFLSGALLLIRNIKLKSD